MVLLHALHAIRVDLNVIHVNYQLRGEASEKDAELVRAACERLNVPCEIRVINLQKKLANGGNLQDEARKVRYSWFDDILQNHPDSRIALAHHRNDQIETFTMNLARKSGVLGLSSMKYEHNGIIRPLIDFSKEEILTYAKNHQIEWREDESNSINKYSRNRFRNEFIPFLNREIDTFSASVLRLIDAFQEKQSELEQAVESFVRTIRETGALPISQFKALRQLEQIELLRELGISASYLPRFSELSKRGKRLEFNQAEFASVVRDENQLTFLKKEYISYELIIQEVDSLPSNFNKWQVYFDASKIKGKLQVRKWKIGDRISPIGMKGSQLVSDIIKDAKITADKKRRVAVVHDDDEILWCVGFKVARTAIADSNSAEILCCTVIDAARVQSEDQ